MVREDLVVGLLLLTANIRCTSTAARDMHPRINWRRVWPVLCSSLIFADAIDMTGVLFLPYLFTSKLLYPSTPSCVLSKRWKQINPCRQQICELSGALSHTFLCLSTFARAALAPHTILRAGGTDIVLLLGKVDFGLHSFSCIGSINLDMIIERETRQRWHGELGSPL
jgi:hypothetical protein